MEFAIFAVFFVIFAVISSVFAIVLGLEGFIGLFVGCIPGGLITWLIFKIFDKIISKKADKENALRRETLPFLQFNEETGVLTLKQRNILNKRVLFSEKVKNISLQYHPSEYVYTGATVGGCSRRRCSRCGKLLYCQQREYRSL